MNEVSFVEKREPDWKKLSMLADKADASPVNLSKDELKQFVRLYRKVSSDLAQVRTKSNNLTLIDFLNDLLGRAYGAIYRPKRKPFWQGIADSIALTAITVRKLRWFALASAVIFVGGGVFSYLLLDLAPATRPILIPDVERSLFDSWKSGHFHERSASEAVLYTGLYSSNNPKVAIIQSSIAAGTFGIGTAILLWQNGVVMGTLTHEMASVGKVPHLFISIAPHGVTEISGLILSGTAGLCLGWALISPGRRKRGDALRVAAKDAMVVLCASVVLMFMAAPVEGFFSFNPRVPNSLKILFAVVAATAWGFFWTTYARSPEEFEPKRERAL